MNTDEQNIIDLEVESSSSREPTTYNPTTQPISELEVESSNSREQPTTTPTTQTTPEEEVDALIKCLQLPTTDSTPQKNEPMEMTKMDNSLGSIKFLSAAPKHLPTYTPEYQLVTEIPHLNIALSTLEGKTIAYDAHRPAPTKAPGHVKERAYVMDIAEVPKWEKVMEEYESTQLTGVEDDSSAKTVEEHFTNIIAQLPIFSGKKLDKIVQVTNVTSNLISLMNSFWLIHKCKNLPKSASLINKVSIVANVTALATSIWQIVDNFKGLKFDKIKEEIPLLVRELTKEIEDIPEEKPSSSYENTAKSNYDFTGWNIVKTFTTLGAILMAILTKCNLISAKNFITNSHLLKATTTYKREGLEFIKIIATEILGIDVVGDRTYINKLKELALEADDLATAPIFEFASNPEKAVRLTTLYKDINQYTDKTYESAGTSNIAKSYLAQLVTSRIRINEKLNTVKEMFTNKQRQCTVGMMLCGAPGVGKSEAIQYIAREIGNILGYSNKVYNVRKSNDFYRVYAGEAFGEFNEFANTPVYDPCILELNSIISGDDVNLAGASLDLKQQPCKLKCVMLTANDITPNLVATLKATSIQAFYDRIERFIIVDEREPQRGDKCPWRKPDFSHLTVNHVVGTFSTASDIKSHKISFRQMIMYMTSRIAAEEVSFLNKGLADNTFILDEAMQKRLNHLKSLITHYAVANSKGGEYFVTRVQGEPGTNKTTMACEILPQIAKSFKIPFHKITNIDQLTYEEKAVYLLDDCLNTDEDLSSYFRWTNRVSNKSLIYINTNLIPYERKRSFQQRITKCFTKKTNLDYYLRLKGEVYSTYPGLARRLGFSGHVKARSGGEIIMNDPKRTFYAKKSTTGLYCNDKIVTEKQFGKMITEAYGKFSATDSRLQYEYAKCPKEAVFDVAVVTDSINSLKEMFTDPMKLIAAMTHTSTKTNVRITSEIREEFPKLFATFKTLLPKSFDDITEDHIKDTIVNYMRLLSSRKQEIALSIYITNLLSMKLYRGIIYDEGRLVEETNIQYEVRKEGVRLITFGIDETFSWKECVRIVKRGATVPETERIGIENMNSLTLYLINNSPLFPKFKIYSIYDDYEQKMSSLMDSRKVSQFIKNPIVISIGIIATISATAGFLYKISKLHKKEVRANADSGYLDSPDPDDDKELNAKLTPYTRAFAKDIFDREKAAQHRQDAYDAGLKTNFDAWEKEFRSNSTFAQISAFEKESFDKAMADLMRKGDVAEIASLIKKSSHITKESMIRIMKSVGNANMVAVKDIIPDMRANIRSIVTEIARNNNVRISYLNGGTNYGLVIKNNLIVTVSHGINSLSDILYVNDKGIRYTAKILSFNRCRDIAIIKVMDRNWVAKKDITSHFASTEDFANMDHGWFIRAFEKETTMFPAPISFIPTGAEIQDPNNPRYKLSEDYFKYRVSYVTTLEGTFKDGDCGLPLINISKSGFKFIGIHNGYTSRDNGMGFFSSLNKEFLLAGIEENHSNSAPEITVPVSLQLADTMDGDSKQAIPQFYIDAFAERRSSILDRKWTNTPELPVIGYFPSLHIRSNPKNSKTWKPICPSIDFEMTKLPAAIDTTHVKDFSKLIQDKFGKYNTLASQAMLFGKQNKKGEIDPEIFKATSRFLQLKMRGLIGDNRNKLRIGEAINGYEALQSMDMTTSTGLYLKAAHKVITKRPPGNENVLFNQDVHGRYSINRTTKPGKDLFDMVLSGADFIERGIPLAVFAKDNAKVELLPIEKVEEGKVRLFSELDLYVNIILRQYFGRQMSHLFKKHLETSYALGANPYADFTFYYHRLKHFKGKLFDTDYSRLDKTIPAELIKEFVYCFCQNFSDEVKSALSYTLSNMFHVLEGSIYRTTRGNASGSFVTTLLNCYVLEFVDVYTVMTRHKELYDHIPSYKQVNDLLLTIIYGDDKVSKYSELLKMDFKILEENALKFGLVLTKAKVEYKDAISFCSRLFLYDEKENIVFPALKQESVVTHLYYGRGPTRENDIARINVALFEACLWPKEFFNRVNGICMTKARNGGYFERCNWYKYEEYRDNFVQYVRSCSESPSLQVDGNLSSNSEHKANNSFDGLLFSKFIKDNKNLPNFNMASYVTKLFEHCQKNNVAIFTRTEPSGAKWSATYTLKVGSTDIVSTGFGLNLREAKQQAALQTLEKLGVIAKSNKLPHVLRTEQPALSAPHLETTTEDDEFHTLLDTLVAQGKIDHLTYTYKTSGCTWTAKVDSATVQTKECDVNFEILCNSILAKSNVGPENIPVEPMTINSASQYQGVGRLPDGNTNAQPVAMAPEMGPPGENINATNELIMCKTLNPLGAPNMLPVGAIGFDAKDLIYTTFLDRDIEIEITNDAPSGTVLFQIPYGVDTPYTNSYIKSYASMHERYAGALTYRFTTIGNQLYSGAIGVAWYPNRITTSTINISEMQKYSYYAKGVQMPWTEDITLHDARQDLFWRKVSGDSGDLSDRPHLICFLFVSVKNPYDAPSTVRMRIASKLNGSTEANPFQFANPALSNSLTNTLSATDDSGTSAMLDVYKHLRNFPLQVYTDGTLAAKFSWDSIYAPYFSLGMNDSSLGGRTIGTTTTPDPFYPIPNQSTFNNLAHFEASWPGYSARMPAMNTTVPVVVTSKLIQMLSPTDLGQFAVSCPFIRPGGGTSSYTLSRFNESKTISNWTTNSSFSVLQVHWSDLVFKTASATLPGLYNGQVYVIGSIKAVTTKGTVIAVFYAATAKDSGPAIINDANFVSFDSEYDTSNVRCSINYDRIETSSSSPSTLTTSLPLGWNKIALTTILPSVVLTDSPNSFTANDDVTIQQDFSKYSSMSTAQCVQFALIDIRSNAVIATVRYLQEYGMFVINKKFSSDSSYKALPIEGRYLAFARLATINRGLEFPFTDTTLWIDRLSTGAMSRAGLFNDRYEEKYEIVRVLKNTIQATSNAWLAAASIGGGAMQGIGQAVNASVDRKFQTKMQDRQFTFLSDMQSKKFNFEEMLQAGLFEHENSMAAIKANNQMAIDTNKARQNQIAHGMEGKILSMPGSSWA